MLFTDNLSPEQSNASILSTGSYDLYSSDQSKAQKGLDEFYHFLLLTYQAYPLT